MEHSFSDVRLGCGYIHAGMRQEACRASWTPRGGLTGSCARSLKTASTLLIRYAGRIPFRLYCPQPYVAGLPTRLLSPFTSGVAGQIVAAKPLSCVHVLRLSLKRRPSPSMSARYDTSRTPLPIPGPNGSLGQGQGYYHGAARPDCQI